MLQKIHSSAKHVKEHYFPGIAFIFLLTLCSFYLSELRYLKQFGISPMITAIFIGIVASNSVHLSDGLKKGIAFVSKKVLRIGVALLGFKISLYGIMEIGLVGIIADLFIVVTTLFLAYYVSKLIKLDEELGILIGFGSAICGASAVLACEGVLQSKTYKASLAVAMVTVFGTIAMFTYPFLFSKGLLIGMNSTTYGIYVGATIHEVGQVVTAGFSVDTTAGDIAIVSKLARVLLLVPAVLILLVIVRKIKAKTHQASNLPFPWFVVVFFLFSVLVTFVPFEKSHIEAILELDKFLLVASMSAIGTQTRFQDFYRAGKKPIILGLILALWLIFGGYLIIRLFS